MVDDSLRTLLARNRANREDGTPESGLWGELADAGMLDLPAQVFGLEDEAGFGLDMLALVANRLGAFRSSEPFVACAIMPAVVAGRLGSDSALHQRLAAGQKVALGWQRATGVSDPLCTGALVAEGALSGRLHMLPTGLDGVIVAARRSGETVLALVDLGKHGVTARQVLSTDGGGLLDLDLDAVRLDDGDILLAGAAAETAVMTAFDMALIANAAQLHGAAAAAFAMTLDYLRTRRQFDQPIGAFQAMQHRAVDMHIQLALAEAAIREAATAFDTDLPVSALASRAKARAVKAALLVAREAVQMHGAIGFTSEAEIGLFVSAIITWSNAYGTRREHCRRHAALGER